MIPVSLTVRGFGPHLDTTVEFDRTGPVCGILALNGSGKTTLLDAIPAALYAEFPSRPGKGSLGLALTQGHTGEGEIVLAFDHDGTRYEASRRYRVTEAGNTTHSATLRRVDDDTVVAGPKVTDFETAVASLLGSKRTALATWFFGQGGAGDLCSSDPAECRSVVGDILGFASLDRESDRFAKLARVEETRAETLLAQIAGEEGIDSRIAETQQSLEDAVASREIASDDIGRLQNSLEAADARIRDAEGSDAESLRKRVAAFDAAKRTVESLASRVAQLEGEERTLATRAAGIADAQAAVEAIASIDARLAVLEERQKLFDDRRTWEGERDRLANAIRLASAELDTLRAKAGVSDDDRALAASLADLRADYQRKRQENTERKARNDERATQRTRLSSEIAKAEQDLASVRARIAKAPNGLFGTECAPCSFLREFAGLPDRAVEIEDTLEDARASLAAVGDDEPLDELEDLKSRGQLAAAAKDRVDAAAQALGQIDAANAKLADLNEASGLHALEEPAKVDDPGPEKARLRADRRQHEPVAAKLEAARNAQQDLDSKRTQLATARREHTGAVAERDRLAEDAASASQALVDRRREIESLTAERDQLRNDLASARDRHTSAVSAVARHEERLASLNEQKARLAERAEEAERVRIRSQRTRTLATVFGKKGVQPILIDQARPDVEPLANQFLDGLTGGQMRLRISTQRVQKNGTVAEDFSIMVRDARGEREASTYSGGEKRLIQTVLRLALLIWSACLHGRAAESLFIDEGFDALDRHNAERLAGLLEDLRKRFAKIIVVTHTEDIAALLPSRIELEKSLCGVAVRYSEN